jgi:hypothetical protein
MSHAHSAIVGLLVIGYLGTSSGTAAGRDVQSKWLYSAIFSRAVRSSGYTGGIGVSSGTRKV